MTRYFFILPEVDQPRGGINIALSCIDILVASGYEAAALYSSCDYSYSFIESSNPAFFHPPLAKATRKFIRRREKLLDTLKTQIIPQKTGANRLLDLRGDDVFVIPEFLYPEYSAIFPQNRRILLAQGFMGFCKALSRDLNATPRFIDSFTAVCATSDATSAAVEALSAHKCYKISLAVSRPSLVAHTAKKWQIAYMPRKRRDEIDIILGCLTDNPAFEKWEFVSIDGLGQKEVDSIISESLIFLSFSQQEGFGLPPAEAMAASCVVIGYTGIGGDEFFKPDFAIPIQDGNVAQFAVTLESTVLEYAQDPKRLDRMRNAAAETIRSRYSPEAMKQSLIGTWACIDAEITD